MKWTLKPAPDNKTVALLVQQLQITPVLASLLVQRGIHNFDEAKLFFRPELSQLHEPWLMKDMDKAVKRILFALESQEKIMVYGDYDVDGTTAVSLVMDYLQDKCSNLISYIPDRYTEGYGISFQGIDTAEKEGVTLIIALDCGIKSIDKIAYANQKNIDFIICDHHLPGEEIPEAVAILNPKQLDCNYPYKELCGCGIGFKLIQGIEETLGGTIENLKPYLDLVAAAIGADIVPITGENRILAKFGLEVINQNPRPGFQAILQQQKKRTFTISDVVFYIAPRINAAGRIEHGKHAVKLLTCKELALAEEISKEIETYNLERRQLDQSNAIMALQQIEANQEQEQFATVVYDPTWHKGVVGIVASRLIETYYRPTIVFTKSGDYLAASARSIKGFDLYAALESCSEHLIQFGGHMHAAGMTCLPEKYEDFKQAFESLAKQWLTKEMLEPEIEVDAEISFADITPKFIRILQQMEPFGPGNMHPVFCTKNVVDTGYAKTLGSDNEHLKLFVKQESSEGVPAIGFKLGQKLALVENRKPFDLVYSIDENEWNGQTSLQLRVKDVKGK